MAGRKIMNIPALIAGTLTAVCGAAVLIGWWLDVPQLKTVLTGLVSMKANTAFAFILAGTGTILLSVTQHKYAITATKSIAVLIIFIAAMTLVEYITRYDFGIDELLFDDPDTSPSHYPGRMAIATALAFLLTGTALFIMPLLRKIPGLATLNHILIIGIASIGGLAMIGYILDFELLYSWYAYNSVALHTAIAFILVAAGFWLISRKLLPEQFVARDKQINRAAAYCLVITASMTGITSFGLMEREVQTILGNGLQAGLNSRVNQIATVLDLRTIRAQIISTRPALLQYMRLLESEPDNMEYLSAVQNEINSFSSHGFDSITVFSANGRILASQGIPLKDTTFRLSVNHKIESYLVWQDRLYLQHRQVLNDDAGVLGTIISEQSLPRTTQALLKSESYGNTSELLLCRHIDDAFSCFPTRLTPEPFIIQPQGVQKLFVELAQQGRTGVGNTVDYRGHRVLGAYSPVEETGLLAVLKIDSDEIHKPISREFQWALLLVCLLTAAGIVLINYRVRPLAAALKASEAEFQNLLESINDGVAICQAFCFVYANDALCSMLGYTRDEFTGLTFESVVDPEFIKIYRERYSQRIDINAKIPPSHYEIRMVCKGGKKTIWVELNARRTEYNQRPAVIVIIRDITQRKNEELSRQELTGKLLVQLEDATKVREQLYQQATRDPLTGLFNRRYLSETLTRELARAVRDKSSLCLAIIDIDYFKRINDMYSHDAGDEMIKSLASLLLNQTRREDIVCRYGGEEFIVVLPSSSLDNARQRMEQIRKSFEKSEIIWGGHKIHTTISIGIAAYPQHGFNNHELISAADTMLYQAKGAGRNRVMIKE